MTDDKLQELALRHYGVTFGPGAAWERLKAFVADVERIPCARCAVLEKRMNYWRDTARSKNDKIAALEAERDSDRQREYGYSQQTVDALQATIAQQAAEIDALLKAVADHVTVRSEQYATIQKQAERIKYLEDITSRSEVAIKTLAEQLAAAQKVIDAVDAFINSPISAESCAQMQEAIAAQKVKP